MRVIVAVCVAFLFSSCSHHHKESHHHHDNGSCEKCAKNSKDPFEHKCAYSLMEGDTHTEGKEEFSLEHRGEKYYFSSAEKLSEFKKSLEANIDVARRNWSERARR